LRSPPARHETLDREHTLRDALVVIDVITDFRHPDGELLLESFRTRQPALLDALEEARARGIPVLYVNDSHGSWDADVSGWIRGTIAAGPAPELVAAVAPQAGETFLRKPRYSAFDHTALAILLGMLATDRVLLAGAATEMCIVQTAIDARELGLKVTILAAACAAVDAEDEAIALAYAERVVGAQVERTPVAIATV
jgi:nicotinamidase-related amidase